MQTKYTMLYGIKVLCLKVYSVFQYSKHSGRNHNQIHILDIFHPFTLCYKSTMILKLASCWWKMNHILK